MENRMEGAEVRICSENFICARLSNEFVLSRCLLAIDGLLTTTTSPIHSIHQSLFQSPVHFSLYLPVFAFRAPPCDFRQLQMRLVQRN